MLFETLLASLLSVLPFLGSLAIVSSLSVRESGTKQPSTRWDLLHEIE